MQQFSIVSIFVAAVIAATSGLAHAQDDARALNVSAEVHGQMDGWLDDANAFRFGVVDTARLWQRDAPLLDVRTDIFADEATTFADVTQTYAQRVRRAVPGDEAVAVLLDFARDLDDRVGALREARAQSTESVVEVLNAMDLIVQDALAAFSTGERLDASAARSPAAIRVAYASTASETRD